MALPMTAVAHLSLDQLLLISMVRVLLKRHHDGRKRWHDSDDVL